MSPVMPVFTADQRTEWEYMPGSFREQFGDDILDDNEDGDATEAVYSTAPLNDLPTFDLVPTSWMRDAACVSRPEVDFFGQGSPYKALAVCSECPVIGECLDFALANEITEGVYGGQPATARRRKAGVGKYRSGGGKIGRVYVCRIGPAVKIGFTSMALYKRMAGLRQENPTHDVRLIASAAGQRRDEAALHDRLSAYRFGGTFGREYYRDAPEVWAALADLGIDSEEVAA